MKYIELTVHTTSEASELVADVMWQYTEGGVAVSDSRDVVALVKGENFIDERQFLVLKLLSYVLSYEFGICPQEIDIYHKKFFSLCL